MSYFAGMNLSVSGLEAHRARLETAAENLANADSSAPQGQPVFAVKRVLMEEARRTGGVRHQVVDSEAPPRLEYDPSHPDAGPDGMVRYPDVNVVTEMAELMDSRRLYEANLAAYTEGKTMFSKCLEIGRA